MRRAAHVDGARDADVDVEAVIHRREAIVRPEMPNPYHARLPCDAAFGAVFSISASVV